MSQNDILDIYNALSEIPSISIVKFESPVIPIERIACPVIIGCDDDFPPGGGGTSNPTPNLEDSQGYLGASPLGIDADYAWTQTGGNGSGVKIIDMEGGYNSSHEDLPTPFIRVNDNNNADHGTAVMSIVAAKNNGIGIKGIAYASQVGFYGWGSNTAESIRSAANNLNAGDVLILEGQINRDLFENDTCNLHSVQFYKK